MALLIPTRSAQRVLEADFTFNFDDTMVPAAGGTAVDFGKTNTAATVFAIINLPRDSIVLGGELVTETAFDAATYAVIVGDTLLNDRYLSTADRKGVARVALTPTGFRNTTGVNIVVDVTAADACTTGKAVVRVQYIIDGRAEEVYPS